MFFLVVNDFKMKVGVLFSYILVKNHTPTYILRIHWTLSTILKANKKVYEVMFFDT